MGCVEHRLDSSPHDPRDVASLQAGAATYVNYCLGCHGLQYMRYKSLVDIGLNEAQIKEYLLFTGEKVGDMIKTVQDPKRRRAGLAWCRPTFRWSHARAARLALYVPAHVLPRFQDRDRVEQRRFPERRHAACAVAFTRRRGLDPKTHRFTEISKGSMSVPEYDRTVRDLVNFLVYVGEPAAQSRKVIGIITLIVLVVLFFPLTYWLKKDFGRTSSRSSESTAMMQLYSGPPVPSATSAGSCSMRRAWIFRSSTSTCTTSPRTLR